MPELRIPAGGIEIDGVAWPGGLITVTNTHWLRALLAAGAEDVNGEVPGSPQYAARHASAPPEPDEPADGAAPANTLGAGRGRAGRASAGTGALTSADVSPRRAAADSMT